MEAIQFRLDRTLSDYKGRDPLVHDGTCHGMLASLLDTFQTNVPDAATKFRRAALILRKSASLMKHRDKSSSFLHPSLWRELVAVATKVASERSLILP